MTYTQNHHLPQWVKSDRVKMEDFNAAMSSIESGINSAQSAASTAQSAANSAQSTANSAQSTANSANTKATAAQNAASSAQTTANTAKSTADAASAKADAAYTPDNKPYAVGSYTGNGATGQSISVGFRPSLVIISGMTDTTGASDYSTTVPYFAITADNANVRRRVQFLNSGFIVYKAGNYDLQIPNLNEDGRHYDYIAFR